jgi:pilus assembly protein CpaB
MNLRSILMLLISLGLAVGATVVANRWMESRLASAGGDRTGVIMAAVDIPFGTKIDATLIKTVLLPNEALPATALKDPQAAIGKIVNVTIVKGDFLLTGQVVENLGGSALAAMIQDGMRAITVGVNEVVGVAGFLLPGNRVDLLVTRRGAGSQTLLQNLKVLAVDQTSSPDKQGPVVVRALTLEVTPMQAEEIAQATEEGSVRFTLRNPLEGNREEPTPEPATPGVLAEAPPPPAPVAKPDASMTVDLIRGTSVPQQLKFLAEGASPQP